MKSSSCPLVCVRLGGSMSEGGAGTVDDSQQPVLPRDARIMSLILKSMGVEDYEPRVVNQLMEFVHRYVSEVLEDAKTFADHAGRVELGLEDVRIAIQSRVNYSFTQPPPRELLTDLAQTVNAKPMPIVSTKAGLLLPHDRHCLTQPNWQVTRGAAEQTTLSSLPPPPPLERPGSNLPTSPPTTITPTTHTPTTTTTSVPMEDATKTQ